MQHILVASDLSERSRPAMRRAVGLARQAGARLTVLHVVDSAIPKDLAHPLEVGARSILADQVAEDAGEQELEADITVLHGDAVEAIEKAIDDTSPDLLVVGLHRRRAFLDQIRETTMEHVIRSSRIPVLLVAKEAARPYAHVLAGIDLSKVCAAALHKVPLVAPGAELTLFHAHEVSFRRESELEFATWKAVFPVPWNLPDPIYMEGSVGQVLDELMARGSYDLLALGGHTRSNAGRYVLGKFASGMIRNPPCDLLIAK